MYTNTNISLILIAWIHVKLEIIQKMLGRSAFQSAFSQSQYARTEMKFGVLHYHATM